MSETQVPNLPALQGFHALGSQGSGHMPMMHRGKMASPLMSRRVKENFLNYFLVMQMLELCFSFYVYG